jgi:SPP1 gp7 family putative phage head morphogenesis protein
MNKADDSLTDDEIQSLLEQLRPQTMINVTVPMMKAMLQQAIMMGGEDVGVDLAFDQINPLISKFLEAFATDEITDQINETTIADLKAALQEGVESGASIDEIADVVGMVFDDADDNRAEMIARTEVNRASNFASTAAYKISGVVSTREWVATDDDRVREDHIAMDGQQVGIDEPFNYPNGAAAMYPGDSGDPSQDCGCRCTTAPVIDTASDEDEQDENSEAAGNATVRKDEGHDDRSSIWMTRHRERCAKWEAKAIPAIKQGFAHQRSAVLSHLRSLR